MTEMFRGPPPPVHPDRPRPILSTSFPIHQSEIILAVDAMAYNVHS
jgi:hypothetical protein